MHIPLFTPYVFSGRSSAGTEGPFTSNNSIMPQIHQDKYSLGNAHLLVIILVEKYLMHVQFYIFSPR